MLVENFLSSRTDFPMLQRKVHGKPFIYFDSAATTLKPTSVTETINRFYAEEYGTVHRAVYYTAVEATRKYSSVREHVRRFLNARCTDEIVFTKGTTEGINLVASSFGKAFINPGDEVAVSEMEHHSNLVPWQEMCRERKAILRILPVNDRGILQFHGCFTPKTKIVAIAHVSNALGTINPIKEIAQEARVAGAKNFVDGAQSAGHMPVDVQDLDVDFYAFSAHKALGPTGVGILYGKKDLLEAMPPYQFGGDMIDQVDLFTSTYQKPPLKFEAGTPQIAQVLGLGAALEYLERLGREAIALYERALLDYAAIRLGEISGLQILGSAGEKGPIISFVVDKLHPLDIGTLLDLRGIAVRTGSLCVQPGMRRFGLSGAVRISFAFYNTFEEMDQFILALKEVIDLLK